MEISCTLSEVAASIGTTELLSLGDRLFLRRLLLQAEEKCLEKAKPIAGCYLPLLLATRLSQSRALRKRVLLLTETADDFNRGVEKGHSLFSYQNFSASPMHLSTASLPISDLSFFSRYQRAQPAPEGTAGRRLGPLPSYHPPWSTCPTEYELSSEVVRARL
ncbi:hypothetical protein T07_127 [Trichinella nelsoni]|uniref:Uncharacterized protein n=1 Tax=Trichinella nelsoni TaxID=6336 RepID=A0A0V0RUP2_9BILA|nr:hypothetical protein T07_127 [Trichinella nelsoni]